ncbi:uncharacterized protein LOC126894396 isoform X30 [Daktulosphaira vitifoliae]|uniref:uncharacterized protein LOC126894396 isoform X30 n=1 Tax=Daktulosphaira vitifoliae TaxID=58002 RepID=UPI0021A9AD62|nr:uncharacterized protein LOC126894396 isoform X30 [Daktulosphaira vitifoliae]
MNLIILIILLTSISFCIGLSKLELHCNFSKYMFNFFKHNEKYLLNLEQRNNIQPVELEDLNTYGAALKTHGEIIMAMLDALRPFTKRTTAKDLMAINLYLNNVSGSLNFITRNCSGKYNRNLSNVLRGYQLHHKTIVDDLNKFINKKCTNVTVDEDFIKCPDYNKSGSLNFITRNCSGKYNQNLSNVLRGYQLHHRTIVDDLNEYINKKCTNVTVDEDFIKCPDYNKSGGPENLLNTLLDVLKEIVARYKYKIADNSLKLKSIIVAVSALLKSNKLDYTIGNDMSQNINGTNYDSIFSTIEQYSRKVSFYVTELKKFKQLFIIVHETYFFKYLYVSRNKNFIVDDIIEYICNQRSYTNLFNKNNVIDIQTETKTEVDKNDDFTFDIEDSINNLYTEIVESSETSNQEVDFVSCTIPESQTKNRPEYIKDYLLFSNLS